ncbi:MAG: LacI family DNA-binding transcriptional regulator [Janthinobacterium lividum]
MRRNNATTLQDIAREAGVTAMTVSVVLNGATSSTRVSEGTRSRITEVAERLRYRPNGVARGLSRRRMDTIGVCCNIDGTELNLYFLEVLNGILEANAEHGQNTTVFSVADWRKDEEKLLAFCDGRVDGMICIGPLFSTTFAETLLHHTPFITLHSNEILPHTHNLTVDDEGGAYAVTRHLIDQGHRRILHFSGQPELTGAQHRLDGYRKALTEAGIADDPALVIPGQFSVVSGRERMTALLDTTQLKTLPTAIFCANDAIAYGCMEVLAGHGLHVPQDISIVGFDDSLTARMTAPPLTTVRQPLRQMGHAAVELLLPRIESKNLPSADGPSSQAFALSQTVFPLELIIRGSVGPPAHSPLQR